VLAEDKGKEEEEAETDEGFFTLRSRLDRGRLSWLVNNPGYPELFINYADTNIYFPLYLPVTLIFPSA